METTLAELAQMVGGTVEGDATANISSVSDIRGARAGSICFIANERYARHAVSTKASAVVVHNDLDVDPACAAALLRVDEPEEAFSLIAGHFAPQAVPPEPGVHPSAVVAEDVSLGRDVSIGPHVVVGQGCSIGNGTVIRPNTTVACGCMLGADCLIHSGVSICEGTTIGDRVIIHSGSVIGADGFGYKTVKGVHTKIPQIGIVEIEDDVEIGACTTIDRARFDKTHIGRGTKIDNLVMIAHNVWIGEHCIIVSQTGIAGSTRIGNHVTVAAQCGLAGHVEIGDGATLMARTGVMPRSGEGPDIKEGAVMGGTPAKPVKAFWREMALIEKLPELHKKIRELEKRLAEREAASEDH